MTIKWFFSPKTDAPLPPGESTGKYHRSSSILPYNWEQVAIAFWVRYPNPYSLHVLSEDVLDRRLTEDNKLVTTRILSKTNRLPKWGERLIRGPQHVFMVEESVVDVKDRTLTTYTRNIGYTKVMTVDEKCVYQPAPEDPTSSTELSRTACIESHLFGFAKAIQTFGVERYKRNTTKTMDGFYYILEHLFSTAAASDNVPEPLSSRLSALTSRAEAIRDSARRAKDLAKQKTSDLLHSSKSPSSAQ